MRDHPAKNFKAFLSRREKHCNKCGFASYSLHVLYKHRHKCRGKLHGNSIVCSYCKRKFNFLALYLKHQPLCVKKIAKQKFLRLKLKEKHLGYQTTNVSFSCPICEASFDTKQKFVSHLKKQSCQSPVKTKKPSLSARKSFNSQKGSKVSSSQEHQDSSVSWPVEDLISDHDDELYYCKWCKSYYPTKKLLKMHIEMNDVCAKALYRSKSHPKRQSLTARKSMSAVAKKSFPNKKTRMMEFYSRKNTRSARKSFPSSKRKTSYPTLEHSSDTEMSLKECPVCYRCFPDLYSFFLHQKKMNHWGKATKTFNTMLKCPFCVKEFSHIFSRDAHLKNHTEIPEHKIKAFVKHHTCNVCSTTFASVFAKMQHERVMHLGRRSKHSGSGSNSPTDSHASNHKMSSVPKSVKKKLKQQPNTCPVCSKAFSHTVLRNKHFNEAHLKIFECQVCNTKFKSMASLTNHMKLSHTKEFECRGCKMSFQDELNLLQHVLRSHPNRDPKLFLPIKLLNSPAQDKEKANDMLASDGERFQLTESAGNMEFFCDVCNIGYLKLCGLQRHRQSKLHRETVAKKLLSFHKSKSVLPSSPKLGLQTVKLPEILICAECSEEFTCIKDFVPHRLSHFSVHSKYLRITEQSPYMCEICSEVLDSHSKVQLHLFWHLQIESTAGSCGNNNTVKKKTIVPDRLSGQHVAKKSFCKQSNESTQEVVIGGVTKPLYTCEGCNVSFTTKEHHSIHVSKLCKKGKLNTPVKAVSGENAINKSNLEQNGIVHCIKCNFVFRNSVKHDLHMPHCLKISFNCTSEGYTSILKAVKSALVHDICNAGCATCGAIFDSPVNSLHLSLHQEENNIDSDEVPEEILRCALCNCLFPVSAFKAHKKFCKVPLNVIQNSSNLDTLKSVLELKSAFAGCISCEEHYDNIDLFAKHLKLHQQGEIKSLCNGEETSLQQKESGEGNVSTKNGLKPSSQDTGESSKKEHVTIRSLGPSQSSAVKKTNKLKDDCNSSGNIKDLRENFSKLLCILISDSELMVTLGYGKSLIEDVLINVLKQMGQKTCADLKLSVLEKFRKNIRTLLELCLKDQVMQDIGRDKTTDEIVVEALNIFDEEE